MSVKHGLLALLQRGPRYGYQLRTEFEHATGGTWPLNIGQVYTTLSRLERDGLVRPTDGSPESGSHDPASRRRAHIAGSTDPRTATTAETSSSHRGQRPFVITDAGRAELRRWFATPIDQSDRPRDELAIKLALAIPQPGVDVRRVVQSQRGATMRRLQEYTRLKAADIKPADLAWRLVLDAMVFQAEAEIRWLDHCEASMVRYPVPPPAESTVDVDDAVMTEVGRR